MFVGGFCTERLCFAIVRCSNCSRITLVRRNRFTIVFCILSGTLSNVSAIYTGLEWLVCGS